MTPEEILLLVGIASLSLAAVVGHYATDDISGLLAILSMGVNGILIALAGLSDLIPTPNPIYQEPIALTDVLPLVGTGILLSIASLIFLFKLNIISLVKGDRLILRDEPIAMFHKKGLKRECRYNASRRCEFYLNCREGANQYILPIKDLDTLAELMDKEPDLDESMTCCRCNELKPQFTNIAHKSDLKESEWRTICEDCTMGFVNQTLEQEDNYISKELILSRTV